MDADALKIIKLGSDVGATKNLTVYECGEDIIIVDLGIGFPDSELLGVDVVIPDITYLLERIDRVRGLFITHGHADHFDAVPYLIDQLNIPIYCSKLVQGLLKEGLKDKGPKGILDEVSFNLISPETEEIVVGNFKVSAFRINHSVPSSMGFAIKTPQGTVLHIADYKIDWTPVIDKPIELGRIAQFGDEGVLCLLSDCLGAANEGYTRSEKTLEETFDLLFENAEGRQILVTTISSNISRMYQVINSAVKLGRKIVFSGRSVKNSAEVARSLGYLPFDDNVFVDERDAGKFLQKDLVYIVAGCYGQVGSALERLTRKDHRYIELEENALVIFSADPSPPGVQEPVERLLHFLTVAGAEVIYSEIQENLHVSGHGMRGDLTTVTAVSKAKYYIPIGGIASKMRAYRSIVEDLGHNKDDVFELLEGQSVVFKDGQASMGEQVPVKQVYINSSGSGFGDIDPVVVKDREALSQDGVFVVIIPIDKETGRPSGGVEVVTRGFVYVKESKSLLGQAKDKVNKTLDKNKDKISDWNYIRNKVERDLGRFLYKETGMKPMIIVTSMAF